MRRRVVTVLSLVAFLGAVPAAYGQSQTIAPPGQSAIDEYLETVPSADGNAPTAAPGSPGSGPGAKAIETPRAGGAAAAVPLATREALAKSGPDGRAAAALADAGAPAGAAAGSVPTADGDPAAVAAGPESKGVVGTVARAVTGQDDEDGGWGALYPIALLSTLVAILALGVVRRRGGGTPA